jgi:hypothetical protein
MIQLFNFLEDNAVGIALELGQHMKVAGSRYEPSSEQDAKQACERLVGGYIETFVTGQVDHLDVLASISTVREKTNIAGLGRGIHAKPRRSGFPPNQGIGVG